MNAENRQPDPRDEERQQPPVPEGEAAANEDAVEQEAGNLQQQLTALQEERDALESRLLRTAADYQNYVRRSHQNVADAREQQLMSVAKRLLVVLDHFDHAMEVDPEKVSAENLMQGVRIVRDELLRTLESFEIRRLEAGVGEEFDPNRHEAMMRQQVEGIEPGHVAAQLQPGYTLGEKTLRPAKVAVAE